MRLLVHTTNRTIHDARDAGAWQIPDGFEVVEVSGGVATYAWPNGHFTRCKLVGGAVVADPGWTARDEARKDAAAADGIDDAKLKAITRALLDEVDARHPAAKVDRAAFRQRALGYLRALL